MRQFEWNDAKSTRNQEKHGVSFEEAATVFDDPNALESFDAAHSLPDEDRFRLIGVSSVPRLLLVVYCEREEDTVRIISARKATSSERQAYEGRG
ncbi:MAG TPA: BrnT family toxin [Planctomycetota bacterium]|jgi:hypothetical protein